MVIRDSGLGHRTAIGVRVDQQNLAGRGLEGH
jgi:hypothetical protein